MLIAESAAPVGAAPAAGVAANEDSEPEKLSLKRTAAVLQVLLATRRAARNEDLAHWYTAARGM